MQDKIPGSGVFVDGRDAALMVMDAMRIPRFGKVGAVLLVESALIHGKDAAFHLSTQTLLGQERFFGGIHAANGRAEAVSLITGANALQPGDGSGLLVV